MGVSGAPDRESPVSGIPVVIICGPTCSGKSSLAINLARKFNAEIISADSRQIYHRLKIGTDRLDEDQWQGIRHHLMGMVDLNQRFTVFDFVQLAQDAILEIHNRGKRVIICGGTGLYLRALTDGIYELPEEDMDYRSELLDLAARYGIDYLHTMLTEVDPEAAAELHPHNTVRVIRALEINHLTGMRKDELNHLPTTRDSRFRFLQIALMPSREELYRRIEERVDQMTEQGLLKEVQAIFESPEGKDLQERKIIGYREIISFIRGELTWNEAVVAIKQNTRRYAKRQFTWFRALREAKIIEEFGNHAFENCIKLMEPFWA